MMKLRLQGDGMAVRIARGILSSPKASIAALICLLLILSAVFAPLIAPQNPYDLTEIDFFDAKLPPMSVGYSGMTYVLGTDGQGRDMLSAMLYGLRTSLAVGVTSGVLAMLLGTALGLIAAYRGGMIDSLIMRFVDLMLGFPTILVALMILVVFGQGIDKVIVALVFVQWAYFARAVRATALVESGKEYAEAGGAYPAQLPAAADRDCDDSGGRRDCRRGDAVLPWHRSADHRALLGAADCQWLSGDAGRALLDVGLSGAVALGAGVFGQCRRRPAA
jgi:ABC-type dipeptide/oligopeptide/nickel transport system permease subunit